MKDGVPADSKLGMFQERGVTIKHLTGDRSGPPFVAGESWNCNHGPRPLPSKARWAFLSTVVCRRRHRRASEARPPLCRARRLALPCHLAQPPSACFKDWGHGFSLRAGIHLLLVKGKGQPVSVS